MVATIHQLRPHSPAVASFLRVGHTGHRKLADFHAAGRLPYRRMVFDASHIDEQSDLLKTVRDAGMETVLDPNFAEMSAIGKFGSTRLKALAWSNPDRPWSPDDFGRNRNLDVAKAIAEFAVAHGVTVVLSPTHIVDTADTRWARGDRRLCEALRRELDRAGGADIAIDYQLITSNAALRDARVRPEISADLSDLPIENIWLRTSGFGATATGAGTRGFIEAVRRLHEVGRPLVADCAGGFAGLASAAFGAVGAISHGVGQKESFKAADWHKPPQGGGGSATRAYVVELDRYFKEEQLASLFAAKGGRSRFGCSDGSCCPHGGEDMIENAHAHFITQRRRQIDDLSRVPEDRREEHFMLRHLDPAVRSARYAAKLKIADEKVLAAVTEAKARLMRLRDAMADLHAKGPAASRSRSPRFRGGARPISAVLGR